MRQGKVEKGRLMGFKGNTIKDTKGCALGE